MGRSSEGASVKALDTPKILFLDAARPEDRPRVGGKAAALAALHRAGLPVPMGFALCADAGSDWHAEVREAYRDLGGRVAVRSSGTAEDLKDASFAGQYETVLGVTGEAEVIRAVERCLASCERASAYASALGARTGPMAVLVQRFVEPDVAGVVFTEHPSDPSALLIEAAAGRGDQVVSGAIRPATTIVDRATRRRRGEDGGLLSDADLDRLSDLALRAESLFGAAQDMEWAKDGYGFVLLQSRPITVSGESPPPSARRLTRANVGEVLPGPIAPLSWSSVVASLESAFVAVARRAGILRDGVSGPFLVRYRARAYLNLSLCLEVCQRLPGLSGAHAERLVLGSGAARATVPRMPLRAMPALLGVAARLAAMARGLGAEVAGAERLVATLPAREAVANAPFDQLQELWQDWLTRSGHVARAHIAASGACGVRLAILHSVLRRLPGDPVDLANRLLGGLEAVESIRPTLALEAIAAEARGNEPLRRSLTEWSPGAPLPADLRLRIDAFLEEFGHRAVSEADLASPAWEDDPGPVFEALRALLASERPPGFGHAARAAARHADLEAVRHRLGPVLGGLLVRFLDGAAASVRQREHTKSLAVRLVAHGRRLTSTTAHRLVERGILARPADVHFLTTEELLGVLAGGVAPAGAVSRRRRIHEREGRLAAPRDIDRGAPLPEPSPNQLRGTAVSPGVGAGKARVLRPGDACVLQPGEVLVAQVLDAGMGPLLASAAGAVVEMGGLLSHGAVVARELGVPCVVDVRGATTRIRNGQRLHVDGGRGSVELLDETGGSSVAPAVTRLSPSDPLEERLHSLEAHRLARESVYFNLQDPRTGVAAVASQAVRPGGRGEAVLTLSLPDGRLLFGFAIEPARVDPAGFGVGGLAYRFTPARLGFRGRLAASELRGFPPGPVPLLLASRLHEVQLDLEFVPSTPAVDLVAALTSEARRAMEPLGRHHVEQSGVFRGELTVDGVRHSLAATGSRDHSWGLRDWSAADHWRLFIARFGDDLAVHALTASCRGQRVAGGFVWDGRELRAVVGVEYVVEGTAGQLTSFHVEVRTQGGERLQLAGTVRRCITIPVQAEARPLALLAHGPYALRLHEHFSRFTLGEREGLGIAEFTERPA